MPQAAGDLLRFAVVLGMCNPEGPAGLVKAAAVGSAGQGERKRPWARRGRGEALSDPLRGRAAREAAGVKQSLLVAAVGKGPGATELETLKRGFRCGNPKLDVVDHQVGNERFAGQIADQLVTGFQGLDQAAPGARSEESVRPPRIWVSPRTAGGPARPGRFRNGETDRRQGDLLAGGGVEVNPELLDPPLPSRVLSDGGGPSSTGGGTLHEEAALRRESRAATFFPGPEKLDGLSGVSVCLHLYHRSGNGREAGAKIEVHVARTGYRADAQSGARNRDHLRLVPGDRGVRKSGIEENVGTGGGNLHERLGAAIEPAGPPDAGVRGRPGASRGRQPGEQEKADRATEYGPPGPASGPRTTRCALSRWSSLRPPRMTPEQRQSGRGTVVSGHARSIAGLLGSSTRQRFEPA